MKFKEFELSHTTKIRVRYADTDKMGIVYNGKYFTYFEVGRTELMRHFGLPYTEFEKAGYILPLIETKAKFINSANYDDELDVNAKVLVSYRPTIKFEYNIFRNKTTIALGYTLHTFLDAVSRKPVKPPKMFFERLLMHIDK